MDYLIIIIIAIGFFLVYKKINTKDSQDNSEEIKELRDSLTKVLGNMESDNKNLEQKFKDEKDNMQKLVLEIVKENTEAQTENFEKESQNLIKSINQQSTRFNDYFARIDTTIESLDSATKDMKGEISDFSKILEGPDSAAAGDLGEYQLENLFKFHNLQENIDYKTQVNVPIGQGNSYRPDAILISKDKCLIIDSKATANLVDIKELKNDATPKDRIDEIKQEITNKVSIQAKKLSQQDYQNLIIDGKSTPEFIIMFIPNENVYLIVKELMKDELIENKGINKIRKGVVLAGPDNLNFIIVMWAYINGILKVQGQVEQIRKAAADIHSGFSKSTEHLDKMRTSIENTVKHWNALQGNIDRNVFPKIKKLEEMGAKSSKEMLESKEIIQSPKKIEKLPDNDIKPDQEKLDL